MGLLNACRMATSALLRLHNLPFQSLPCPCALRRAFALGTLFGLLGSWAMRRHSAFAFDDCEIEARDFSARFKS